MFSVEMLQEARRRLAAGEVIAAPAEGVYGYCADPFNKLALARLVALKKRNNDKGFVTLIGSTDQLDQLVRQPLAPVYHEAMNSYWPGQVTILFPAGQRLPKLLTGQFKDVAVRLPQPPYMRQYLQMWAGPLVSTSANLSGEDPIRDPNQIPDGIFVLKSDTVVMDGSVSRVFDPVSQGWLR